MVVGKDWVTKQRGDRDFIEYKADSPKGKCEPLFSSFLQTFFSFILSFKSLLTYLRGDRDNKREDE